MHSYEKDHLITVSRRQQFAMLETKGEGPRSGGDEDPSGAVAKRKEGVQPPGDCSHDECDQFYQRLRSQGDTHWRCAQEHATKTTLGESSILCKSAALLLHLANASQEDDAVAARRWLQSIGIAAGIATAVSETVDGWSK